LGSFQLTKRLADTDLAAVTDGGAAVGVAHDWADRLPAIVVAALRIKAASFLIDGEAVITP
jgi:hypothetical protein